MAIPQKLAATVVLLIGLAGCGILTGPSDSDRLEAAQARWDRSSLKSHYQVELTRSCFCGFPGAFPLTGLEVVDGVIVRAWEVAGGNPVPRGLMDAYPTVEDLFDLIQFEIAFKAAEVRVEYDPEHGAPMQIDIDRIRQAIDDELSVTIHLLDAGVLNASPRIVP